MDRKFRIQGNVPSEVTFVNHFLAGTMNQIQKYIKDEDTIFDIRLIIDELVVNGAKHGNKWDESKKVFLKVNLEEEELKIVVQDEGEGLNYSTNQYDCKELKCSGRGLVIVEALADTIVYEGNKIFCKKKIRTY